MNDPSHPDSWSLDPRGEGLLEDLVDAARDTQAAGLVVSTSGNISVRIDDERFAVSAARTRLGALTRDRIVVLSVADSNSQAPQPPSRETPLHRAIYRRFPSVRAVLHFQSVAGTALGCRSGPLPDLCFLPEVAVYVRRIGEVPYLPPGSEDLAQAVVRSLSVPDTRIVQLRNHGQVVVGDTPQQAVERATFFELAARIFLSSGFGSELRRFTPEERALLWSY